MAETGKTTVITQSSMYSGNLKTPVSARKLGVYFALPAGGITPDTGVLLLMSGHGPQADSAVFGTLREALSDRYNLVVVQTLYFGAEFLKPPESVRLSESAAACLSELDRVQTYTPGMAMSVASLAALFGEQEATLEVTADIRETPEHFHDMGLLQAVDNLTALIHIMNLLYQHEMPFNTRRIICGGQGHGAYLAHLCNLFSPRLFAAVLDNDAPRMPDGLCGPVKGSVMAGRMTLNVRYDYLAEKIHPDPGLMALDALYSQLENPCQVVYSRKTAGNEDSQRFFEAMPRSTLWQPEHPETGSSFPAFLSEVLQGFGERPVKDTALEMQQGVVLNTARSRCVVSYAHVVPRISLFPRLLH